MAVPLREITVLNQDLVSRLEREQYIEEHEIFGYRKKLQNISKDDAEGAATWAFYYACVKDNLRSLECFRKSINFNDVNFFYNYLIFLKNCGLVHEHICAISKISDKYKGYVLIEKERHQASFWQGDVSLMLNRSRNIISSGSDQEIETYKRLEDDIQCFIERSKVGSDGFKMLMNITTDFVDEYKIPYSHTGIICLKEEWFNAFFVSSTIQDSNRIREYNFLYSVKLAKNQQFDDKNFMAYIISDGQNMSEALSMDITYEDGYYIAECNEIHLVTESNSLEELHGFILDLTPDLIELNELDLDPDKVLFTFNYSKSAKDNLRGL